MTLVSTVCAGHQVPMKGIGYRGKRTEFLEREKKKGVGDLIVN